MNGNHAKRRSAADLIRDLDHALKVGHHEAGVELWMHPKLAVRDVAGNVERVRMLLNNYGEIPFLETVQDQYASQMLATNFLFGPAGVCGFRSQDPPHRDKNDLKSAIKKAGVEGLCLRNIIGGP